MEYRQIIAVTGLGGLYQLMNTKNDGAIVRSLADKTIKFIPTRKHQITPLESIEIYTTTENVRLHEIFEKMKDSADQAIELEAKKDNKLSKAYFQSIVPDYDESRVYISDIKKIIKWFVILKNNDLLNFEYLKENTEEAVEESNNSEKIKEQDVAQKVEPASENTDPSVEEADKPKSKKKAKTSETTEKKATAKKAAPKKKKEAKEAESPKEVKEKKVAPKKKKAEA